VIPAYIVAGIIDRGWVANPEAEPILGMLVFEDVVIAVYLALVAALLSGSGDLTAVATDVARAFVFLGAVAAVAWYGTDLVERAFDLPNDELFLLHVLGATTLVAGAALATGVSEAVAAFFVGTAFSGTPHTERIEDVVSPVRDLFAAVFFFSIGLSTDVTALTGVAGLLVVAVLLTTGTKLVSGTLGGQIYDLPPPGRSGPGSDSCRGRSSRWSSRRSRRRRAADSPRWFRPLPSATSS
jgi:CPA2 family monovalent cation:H+ antiporter-2